MSVSLPDLSITLLRQVTVSLVRRDGPDLSARQLATLLTCYLEPQGQTVRGLAKELNVSRGAISRALDRLSEFDLIRRKPDPSDGRSVLVEVQPNGNRLVRDVRDIMRRVTKA